MLIGKDVFDLEGGDWSTDHIANKPPKDELVEVQCDPQLQELILQLLAKHPDRRRKARDGVREVLSHVALRDSHGQKTKRRSSGKGRATAHVDGTDASSRARLRS